MYSVFSNSKPWINPDIKALLKEEKKAFRSGNKEELKAVQKELRRKVRGEEQLQEEDGEPAAAEKYQRTLEKS